MALDIHDLRARIAAAGLNWQAEETEVSRRFAAAGGDTNLFGLSFPPEEAQNARKNADWEQRDFQAVALPAQIDWRDHDGANWLSPIRDQGTCGACVAFATIAVLEARVRRSVKDPALALELSAAHLSSAALPLG